MQTGVSTSASVSLKTNSDQQRLVLVPFLGPALVKDVCSSERQRRLLPSTWRPLCSRLALK